MAMTRHCPDYCGAACVDGSCPKALYEENPEYFDGRPKCSDCYLYEGCKDCCIAFYQGITEAQCQDEHGGEFA